MGKIEIGPHHSIHGVANGLQVALAEVRQCLVVVGGQAAVHLGAKDELWASLRFCTVFHAPVNLTADG